MEQNKDGVNLGIKLIPKKEMYITTSDGRKYKIKDVLETLVFINPKRVCSVFKFNVSGRIKPIYGREVVNVNGVELEVYRGDKCFVTTHSLKPEEREKIGKIWEGNNHEE